MSNDKLLKSSITHRISESLGPVMSLDFSVDACIVRPLWFIVSRCPSALWFCRKSEIIHYFENSIQAPTFQSTLEVLVGTILPKSENRLPNSLFWKIPFKHQLSVDFLEVLVGTSLGIVSKIGSELGDRRPIPADSEYIH